MSYLWGPFQMLAACILFILSASGDKTSRIRILLGIPATILLYILLPLRSWSQNMLLWQIFWAAYLLLCVLLIRFCLRCHWRQAVYTATCSLALQHIFLCLKLIYRLFNPPAVLPELLILIILYSLAFRFIGPQLFTDSFWKMSHLDVLSSIVILLLVFGVTAQGESHPLLPSLAYELADIICCSYVLWMQAVQQERQLLEREKENLEMLVTQQARQYEITSGMIERINQKCHDIKHQLLGAVGNEQNNSLREYLHSLADSVMVYDTAIRTGNKALDTVLMEKGLICRDKHIQWTCMADGACISFIRPGDIYALFGNLVDNAIEASEKIEDINQRIINVKVSVHESLLMILVENLYKGEIVFDHGFPVTTKADASDHGYGVKSVDYIARSYGGTLNISTRDQICQAKLLIPVPDKAVP